MKANAGTTSPRSSPRCSRSPYWWYWSVSCEAQEVVLAHQLHFLGVAEARRFDLAPERLFAGANVPQHPVRAHAGDALEVDHHQRSAGPQRAPDRVEHRSRILEVVIGVADENEIDRARLEARIGLRRDDAHDIVQSGRARLLEVALDEAACDVDRVDAALRPDSGGEKASEKPGAGANVGDRLPGL